jgi:transcriptional antiterminator NusG
VENRGLRHLIEEVLVPVETVTASKNGKTVIQKHKLFPGYVYVKMIITDETWYICRNTRGVTGFVGPASKPVALTEEEIKNLGVTNKVVSETFEVGEHVKIISGVLEGSDAVVKEVNDDTIVVAVTMFGRETPATLNISAVEKL